jgi:hypothetical protein
MWACWRVLSSRDAPSEATNESSVDGELALRPASSAQARKPPTARCAVRRGAGATGCDCGASPLVAPRAISPSRFPGDTFGQRGREAVGHGHRNNRTAGTAHAGTRTRFTADLQLRVRACSARVRSRPTPRVLRAGRRGGSGPCDEPGLPRMRPGSTRQERTGITMIQRCCPARSQSAV